MRQRSKNKLSTAVLVFVLMFLGIGYAYLNTTLSINGVTDVDSNSWDIHFDNVQVSTGSVSGTQVIDAAEVVDDTTVSFHVNLKEPGEFYEFTVDAVNDGTIDAMIESIVKKVNNSTSIPAYLRFDIKYSEGIPIAENHLLSAESLETYKVRVEYRTDIDPSDLPSTAQSLTLSFEVEYVQADENAIRVPHPTDFSTDSWEIIILAVQNGNTSAYNVGDTKTIELGNSLGTHTLRIANKSTPAECSTSGFSQTACGFVLEFADIISMHEMNSTNTNVGGWPLTTMRTYLNDTNDTTSIINSLPEVLRNAIIDTTVVSGHGSTAGETNFVTTDKLYLLCHIEVFGDQNSVDSVTLSETRQLDYYTLAPEPISSIHTYFTKNYNNAREYWLMRSAYANYTSSYRTVTDTGQWNSSTFSTTSRGVSPAFRLG